MRPPVERQSALRAPLNYVFRTEAAVRILRVLTQAKSALGKTEVARRAELNASGVRRTIDSLLDLGLLEPVGTGPRQAVGLRSDHPLAPALESLFAAERSRFDRLLDDLRSAAAGLQPPVVAAWIEGPAALEVDRPGDPLIIGVLAPSPQIDSLADRLVLALDTLMRPHDVLIEVRPRTRADLATASEDDLSQLSRAIPLVGASPLSYQREMSDRRPGGRQHGGHAEVDRRMLELAGMIADRLARDPSLVERARDYITRRLDRASAAERQALLEWAQLLESTSLAQLRKFLVDRGERATRLRQSLPFVDVLAKEERDQLFKEAGS
jgi:hypothetical protein